MKWLLTFIKSRSLVLSKGRRTILRILRGSDRNFFSSLVILFLFVILLIPSSNAVEHTTENFSFPILILSAENSQDTIRILPALENSTVEDPAPTVMSTILSLVMDKVKGVVGEVIHLEATLTYENMSPVADKNIEFYTDQPLGTDVTNNQGRAVFDWDTANWLPEAYRIFARYGGDDTTSASTHEIEIILEPHSESTTENVAETFSIASSNVEERERLGYKFANNSNVILSTNNYVSCAWKPDNVDDGWKMCEAVFEVENQNMPN